MSFAIFFRTATLKDINCVSGSVTRWCSIKSVLTKFSKFTGKHLCRSLFFKLKAVCSCFEIPWCCLEKPSTSVKMQKYPSRGVLRKKYSENMLQIYRKTPMPKCDFNSAWVFSCKFAAYLQNILFQEHLWMTASENGIHPGYWPDNSTKFSEELLNSFMTGVVII